MCMVVSMQSFARVVDVVMSLAVMDDGCKLCAMDYGSDIGPNPKCNRVERWPDTMMKPKSGYVIDKENENIYAPALAFRNSAGLTVGKIMLFPRLSSFERNSFPISLRARNGNKLRLSSPSRKNRDITHHFFHFSFENTVRVKIYAVQALSLLLSILDVQCLY